MTRILASRDAVREAIREKMARDETVVMFGEDVGRHGGAFGVSQGLMEEFGPTRITDTPISESVIVGMGYGDVRGFCAEDGTMRYRARGVHVWRNWRRNCRANTGIRLRLSRRADHPNRRSRMPNSIQP